MWLPGTRVMINGMLGSCPVIYSHTSELYRGLGSFSVKYILMCATRVSRSFPRRLALGVPTYVGRRSGCSASKKSKLTLCAYRFPTSSPWPRRH